MLPVDLSCPFHSPHSRPVAHHRPALDDMQTLLAMVLSHGVAIDRLQDLRAEIAVAAQTPVVAPVHSTPGRARLGNGKPVSDNRSSLTDVSALPTVGDTRTVPHSLRRLRDCNGPGRKDRARSTVEPSGTTVTEGQPQQIAHELPCRPLRKWVQRQPRRASVTAAAPRSTSKATPSPTRTPPKKRPAAAQPAQAQKPSQRPRRQAPPVVQREKRGGAANKVVQKQMSSGPVTTPTPPERMSTRKQPGQSTSKSKHRRGNDKGQKRKAVGGSVEERTEVHMSSAGLYKESKGERVTNNNNPFTGFHRVRASG